MRTIDTRQCDHYSPLIPATMSYCEAASGERVSILMNRTDAFSDFKEFLADQNIGFREVYDGDTMIVEFTKK